MISSLRHSWSVDAAGVDARRHLGALSHRGHLLCFVAEDRDSGENAAGGVELRLERRCQSLGEFGGRRKALLEGDRKCTIEHVVDQSAQRQSRGVDRFTMALHGGAEDANHRLSLKRGATVERGEGQDGQPPEIPMRRRLLRFEYLFGAHRVDRARRGLVAIERRLVERARHAEVDQFGFDGTVVFENHDVGEFHVAMDHPGGVDGIEGRADLPYDGQKLSGRQSASAMEPGSKVFPLDFLEDDIRYGAGVMIEHPNCVRGTDARGNAGLSHETLACLGMKPESRTKDLDGYVAPHTLVVCAEDTAHSSFSQ
jgi:hypothetical protein